MSSEKKTLRIPDDTYDSLVEMSKERGLNEHRTGIRAIQRGLQAYGYGEFVTEKDSESDPWLKTIFGEVAKALAVMGVAFLLSSIVADPIVLWYATATLGASCLFLLAERNAAALATILNTPDHPPWVEPESDAE